MDGRKWSRLLKRSTNLSGRAKALFLMTLSCYMNRLPLCKLRTSRLPSNWARRFALSMLKSLLSLTFHSCFPKKRPHLTSSCKGSSKTTVLMRLTSPTISSITKRWRRLLRCSTMTARYKSCFLLKTRSLTANPYLSFFRTMAAPSRTSTCQTASLDKLCPNLAMFLCKCLPWKTWHFAQSLTPKTHLPFKR